MRMTTRLFHCGLDTTRTQNGFFTMATVHVFLACVMLLMSPLLAFAQESRPIDILPKCLGTVGLRVGDVPSLSRLLLKHREQVDAFDPRCWSTLDKLSRGHISRIMDMLCGPIQPLENTEPIQWALMELCGEFSGELLVFDRLELRARHSMILRADCDSAGAHKRLSKLAKLLYPSSVIESQRIGSVDSSRVFSSPDENGRVAGNGLVWWFQDSMLLVSNSENNVEWYQSLIASNSIPNWSEQILSFNCAAPATNDRTTVDLLLWGAVSVQRGEYFGFERFYGTDVSASDLEVSDRNAIVLAAIGFDGNDCSTSTRVLISTLPTFAVSAVNSTRPEPRDANEVPTIASLIPLEFRRITAIRGKLNSLWYSNVPEIVITEHHASLGLFDRFLAMLSRDSLTEFESRSNGMLWIIELPAARDDENQSARVVFALNQTTGSELSFSRFCDEIDKLPGEGDVNDTLGRRIDLGTGRKRVLIYDSRRDAVVGRKILALAKENEISFSEDGLHDASPIHIFVSKRSGVLFVSASRRDLARINAGLTVSNSAVLTGIVSRAAGRQGRLELTMPEATDLLLLRHRYQSSSRRVADEWLLMRFPPEVRWSVPAGDGVSVVEAITFQRLSPLPEFLPPRSQRPSE